MEEIFQVLDEPTQVNHQTCPNAFSSGVNGQRSNGPAWHRIKWTDEMVKILITLASYIMDEEVSNEGPIVGRWKFISRTMVERGIIVSPQQCEDKFNDLCKRYKRLNDILGSSISCEVVENPRLMDSMTDITEKVKDEVNKILRCKQLFYREMWSYHNRDRKYLPHNEALRNSLRSVLKGKKVDVVILDMPAKRTKRQGGKCNNGGLGPPTKELIIDLNNANPDCGEDRWMELQGVELEKTKLRLEKEMFELEKEKFEWSRLCQVEDEKLLKMKQENELMRLENEHLAFQIRAREMVLLRFL